LKMSVESVLSVIAVGIRYEKLVKMRMVCLEYFQIINP